MRSVLLRVGLFFDGHTKEVRALATKAHLDQNRTRTRFANFFPLLGWSSIVHVLAFARCFMLAPAVW